LVKDVESLPTVESDYLNILIEDVNQFGSTTTHSLMQGPVYLTEKGIKAKEAKKWFIPAVKVKRTLFKPLLIFGVLLAVVALIMYSPLVLGISFSVSPIFIIFLFPMFIFYMPAVGTFDRDSGIYPLRKRYRDSQEVHVALEALGKMDELLSF